jgi:hypothetical protein
MADERALLQGAIREVRTLDGRSTLVEVGRLAEVSTYLLEGVMSRYIDDRKGLRLLVATHAPGEFADLHGYPMRKPDHSIGTLAAATVAIVPHASLKTVLVATTM